MPKWEELVFSLSTVIQTVTKLQFVHLLEDSVFHKGSPLFSRSSRAGTPDVLQQQQQHTKSEENCQTAWPHGQYKHKPSNTVIARFRHRSIDLSVRINDTSLGDHHFQEYCMFITFHKKPKKVCNVWCQALIYLVCFQKFGTFLNGLYLSGIYFCICHV